MKRQKLLFLMVGLTMIALSLVGCGSSSQAESYQAAATLHNQGRDEEAIAAAEAAVQENSDHADTHALLGFLYLTRNVDLGEARTLDNYAQAIARLTRAKELY